MQTILALNINKFKQYLHYISNICKQSLDYIVINVNNICITFYFTNIIVIGI